MIATFGVWSPGFASEFSGGYYVTSNVSLHRLLWGSVALCAKWD